MAGELEKRDGWEVLIGEVDGLLDELSLYPRAAAMPGLNGFTHSVLPASVLVGPARHGCSGSWNEGSSQE